MIPGTIDNAKEILGVYRRGCSGARFRPSAGRPRREFPEGAPSVGLLGGPPAAVGVGILGAAIGGPHSAELSILGTKLSILGTKLFIIICI